MSAFEFDSGSGSESETGSDPALHHRRSAEMMAAEMPTNGAPPRPLSFPRQLKLKQQQFCEYYVHHGNAARAAREAGYSAQNAAQQGSGLLRHTKVRAYIHELRQKHALETVWEMEDAVDRLDVIYDAAMSDRNYSAAVRAVEAQTRIRLGAAGRINRVATQTLEQAPVPEGGALKQETDHIRQYMRPRPGDEDFMEDMSPEVTIGVHDEPIR
jgi:phage terminase small subunit